MCAGDRGFQIQSLTNQVCVTRIHDDEFIRFRIQCCYTTIELLQHINARDITDTEVTRITFIIQVHSTNAG